MLTKAIPEAHNGWVTLLDGLNGFVPDPPAIEPKKRRPPGVTMDSTSALTGSVKRLQLGVFHVPVHRYKAQEHYVCQPTACGLNFTVKRMVIMFMALNSTCETLRSNGLRFVNPKKIFTHNYDTMVEYP